MDAEYFEQVTTQAQKQVNNGPMQDWPVSSSSTNDLATQNARLYEEVDRLTQIIIQLQASEPSINLAALGLGQNQSDEFKSMSEQLKT